LPSWIGADKLNIALSSYNDFSWLVTICAEITALKMANVRLENIKRKFNNVTAIEDITLKFRMGNFGCCRTIGLWKSDSADDRWAGNRHRWKTLHWDVLVNDVPARQRDVAMVFQDLRSLPSYERGSEHRLRVRCKADPKQFKNG